MNDDVGGKSIWLDQWISRGEPQKIRKRTGGGRLTVKEREHR